MIRYDPDPAAVEAAIRQADAKWFDKARKRTAAMIDLGRFEDASPIWSTVKPAFMVAHQNKCVFCERQFESADYGKIEFDVEHFRPKSSVQPWPDPVRHPRIAYTFKTGDASPTGYFWLAYDTSNYAASCKVCNTTLKLNYFPVAGSRAAAGATGSTLAKEQPYLCYPIGQGDDDPEDLVTFVATTAVPARKSGHKRRRGQVIIDFFGLNEREQLHRERARMIGLFGGALQAEAEGRASQQDVRLIGKMDSPALPHAACLRAHRRLWKKDAKIARRAYELCRDFATADAGEKPPQV